jgi:hypothetical protein
LLCDLWSVFEQYHLTDGSKLMMVTSFTGKHSQLLHQDNNVITQLQQSGIGIHQGLYPLSPEDVEKISSKLSDWRSKLS